MKFATYLVSTLVTATCLLSASAEPTPSHNRSTPAAKKADTISSAVGLNELKIEMAETRLKLIKDPSIISDLASALEEYLNTTCMAQLPQTLSYAGHPSDPICIARIQRLLEINPNNPVAVCAQEGIASKPCIDAYQNQAIVIVYPATKADNLDPAIRVGLSKVTMDRIAKVEESLQAVNAKYKQTLTPDEKRELLNDAATLYDQILNLSCKVSAVGFVPGNDAGANSEPEEISQARERLLQIPPAIRGDYQKEMSEKAEKELADPQTSPDRAGQLKELLQVIKDPDGLSKRQAANLKRTRYILSKCAETLNLATKIVPDLPSITCFHQGWYSPKCRYAIKKWQMQKQQEGNKATNTPTTSGAKPSMITRF